MNFNQNLIIESITIPKYKESEFKNVIEIGQGAFAVVYKAFHYGFGTVALKINQKPLLNRELELQEVNLLIKHSRHPNIVQVYGLLTADQSVFNKDLGFIMEYMDLGSLDEAIHNAAINYSMKQVFSWIRQAALGLKHLHDAQIIHRDVKPGNFLLGKSLDDLKISDFGLAKPLTKDTTKITRGLGTTHYMAPELIEFERYSFPADIYALAISIWEMANRRSPYEHLEESGFWVIERIAFDDERPLLGENSLLHSLLKQGWDCDPDLRPKLPEFIEFALKEIETADDTKMISIGGDCPIARKLDIKDVDLLDSENLILIIGGKTTEEEPEDSLFLFSYKNNAWIDLSLRLPCKLHGHAALLLNGEIYVIGGEATYSDKTSETLKFTYKLSNLMDWERVEDMNQRRYGITNSSVVFDGCLWVMGGWDGRQGLKSVEKFDPRTGKWTINSTMSEGRISGSAVVFNNKIYAFGGFSGVNFPALIEVLDPSSGVWTPFCVFPKKRQGIAPVIDGTNLVILGGWNGDYCERNSWKLNLAENSPEAEELPDMEEKRTDFTGLKIGEEIVVFGGCNGYHKPMKLVEVFDGKSWSRRASLPQNKAFYGAIQVTPQIVENLKKFIR